MENSKIDWVTKRFLMETAGRKLSPAARKKIDIRYHEMSPDAYFEQLTATGLVERITTDEDIERLLAIPIRRISLYDMDKNRDELKKTTDAIRADTAFIVTSLLQGVVQRGTATRARRVLSRERSSSSRTRHSAARPGSAPARAVSAAAAARRNSEREKSSRRPRTVVIK